MLRAQFFEQQRAEMQKEYALMKAARIKQPERYYALSIIFDVAYTTVSQILFNPNYRKPTNHEETKTVPKSA